MGNINNIPLKKFQKFLTKIGWKKTRQKGSHKHYTRKNLNQTVTIDNTDPVSKHIVKNTLRTLNLSNKDFFEIYNKI